MYALEDSALRCYENSEIRKTLLLTDLIIKNVLGKKSAICFPVAMK